MRMLEVERRLRLLLYEALHHFSSTAFRNRGAAVGKYECSGHETRFIGSSESKHIGHLLRSAAPAKNGAGKGLLLHLCIHRASFFICPGRIVWPWPYAKPPHAVLALFVSHPSHEGVKKTLRTAVGCRRRLAHLAGFGSGRNNDAAR